MSGPSETCNFDRPAEPVVNLMLDQPDVESLPDEQKQDTIIAHVSQTQVDSQMLDYDELPTEAKDDIKEDNLCPVPRGNLISRDKRDDTFQPEGFNWSKPQQRRLDLSGTASRNKGLTLSGKRSIYAHQVAYSPEQSRFEGRKIRTTLRILTLPIPVGKLSLLLARQVRSICPKV